VEDPGHHSRRTSAAIAGQRLDIRLRRPGMPASGTVTDAGSTPLATSTSRSAARATTPLREGNAWAVITSAWTTAASTIAGAEVGCCTS
jgi:phage-related minor tail protein